MSKELEALIRIEDLLNRLYETDVINDDHTHDTNIIGKALKRLEELEKAFVTLSKDDEKAKKLLSLEIEKNRAFEIIKEKKVDVAFIIENPGPEAKKVFWYNSSFTGVLCEGWRMLSQEEYDLLRKVLL